MGMRQAQLAKMAIKNQSWNGCASDVVTECFVAGVNARYESCSLPSSRIKWYAERSRVRNHARWSYQQGILGLQSSCTHWAPKLHNMLHFTHSHNSDRGWAPTRITPRVPRRYLLVEVLVRKFDKLEQFGFPWEDRTMNWSTLRSQPLHVAHSSW